MVDDLATIYFTPQPILWPSYYLIFFFFTQPTLWLFFLLHIANIRLLRSSQSGFILETHGPYSHLGLYPMTCAIASNPSIFIIKTTAKAIILRGGVNHTIQYWYSVLWYYPDMYQLSGTKCSSSGDACFAGLSHFPKFSVCFGSRSNCPHCRFCC